MKMDLDINIGDVVKEFELTQPQVNSMVSAVKQSLLMEIHRNWSAAANSELNSSRAGYLRGLVMFDDGEASGGVKLVGKFNNMVENGISAFDMKQGFQNSSKVKMSKKGNWYMYVPFRWATPGALGDNEVFSNVMPQELYDIIRSKSGLKPSIKSSDLTEQFSVKQVVRSATADLLNNKFKQYVHKSSIYEGIVKNTKTFPSGAKSSTYSSFRAVGKMSDPASWIHSGIKMHNLAAAAIQQTDIDLITNNTVDRVLSEFGF